jgi:F-type H+-transporting ATPase subunit c
MRNKALVYLTVAAVAALPGVAMAQGGAGSGGGEGFRLLDAEGARSFGATIGVALVIFGGALSIARIGCSAVESMARQPEVAGSINTAMIITAAMVEGATLFAVVVCLLAVI